jgi:hypothetical protein
MVDIAGFDLLRLDGGINQGLPGTHIGDQEAIETENWYSWPGQLVARNGLTRVTTTAFGQNLRGIFAYKKAVGDWILLLMADSALAKLSGSSIVAIPSIGGTPFVTGDRPASMRQYKDTVYISRRGIVNLQRTDGVSVGDAGISRPITAPTLAEGAAGDLDAGVYQGIVSFVNIDTGAESDWSPVSADATIGASKRINWSAIPTSLGYQVSGRNLYRTVKGGRGQYFFVARIVDNFTTSYVDNVKDVNLGDPASLDNGMPPQNLRFIEIYKERLWGTDGRDVFYSREGFPESFAEDFLIQVYPDDGHECRGLLAFGASLLIGKTNAVHYVSGSNPDDFELNTLSDKHGCASGHTMAAVRSAAFWYGGDDFYMTDGSSVRGIGSPKIKTILESIPEENRDMAVSFTHPTLKWYVTAIPDSTGENAKELVFNYETGTWDVFTRPTFGGYSFAGEFANEQFGKIMYATYRDGHLYQWHEGLTDAGAPIVCRRKSKRYGFDKNGLLKSLMELKVLATVASEDLTLRLYRDEETSAVGEKTIYLGSGGPWKRTGLNNIRKLANTVTLELEYSGQSRIVVSGVSFKMAAYERSLRKI